MDETNLLSLIRPWLDNIYQITTKIVTVQFCKKKNASKRSLGRWRWPGDLLLPMYTAAIPARIPCWLAQRLDRSTVATTLKYCIPPLPFSFIRASQCTRSISWDLHHRDDRPSFPVSWRPRRVCSRSSVVLCLTVCLRRVTHRLAPADRAGRQTPGRSMPGRSLHSLPRCMWLVGKLPGVAASAIAL
jgi:hypothetical protein